MASDSVTLRTADEILSGAFDHAVRSGPQSLAPPGRSGFPLPGGVGVASGIVAYALYDTSVSGAYESGRRLQLDPMLLGRLLRGLHRYAADGFMLLTVLHLVREAVRGHFLGVRWFSWLTGIPLVWLLWIAGITGLWLLWDERSLYSITATAEWLQALPLAGEQLARNFLSPGAMNDRFFSLVMFVHIGVPLLLLAGVWIHVERVSHARILAATHAHARQSGHAGAVGAVRPRPKPWPRRHRPCCRHPVAGLVLPVRTPLGGDAFPADCLAARGWTHTGSGPHAAVACALRRGARREPPVSIWPTATAVRAALPIAHLARSS